MPSRSRTKQDDKLAEIITLRGHGVCWRKYSDRMSASAKKLYRSLVDIPRDEVVRRQGWFHLVKQVAPFAGGGCHTRLSRGVSTLAERATIEVFSPKKAAEGKTEGFRPLDVPVVLEAAEQGDVVFFRARAKEDINLVSEFFATSSLLSEKSKSDS